jgi:hypothetical protein
MDFTFTRRGIYEGKGVRERATIIMWERPRIMEVPQTQKANGIPAT